MGVAEIKYVYLREPQLETDSKEIEISGEKHVELMAS
jgi:hypothetical protein